MKPSSFDLIDAIEDILSSIEEKSFDEIDRKAVLRSFSAAAGGGFSEGSIDNLRKYKADKLTAAASATKEAYRLAVDFLSTDLGIPSSRHIPYVNQIVVLAELFRVLPQPNAIQRLRIKQWFWRTAVSGYFGGWNTGNMAADQALVRKFASGEIDDLSEGISDPGTSVWTNQQFRLNTAHSKILSLLPAFNAPVDLLTAQRIDADKALHQSNSKEFHHFFPKDYLLGKKTPMRKANALANFVMLTAASNKKITNRSPSDYLREASKELGAELKTALETNLISDAVYAAALNDDCDSFLDERAKTIAHRVGELTGW